MIFHALPACLDIGAFSLVLLVVSTLMLIPGCVSQKSPVAALSVPHFVPQSPPDSIVETGIRQDPSTGGILLQWYSVVGVAGYQVYRSDSTDKLGIPILFSQIRNVVSSSSLNDTSIVDVGGIQTGIRYYYYLLAYAPDGSSSSPSDTVNYLLLNRPIQTQPTYGSAVNAPAPEFHWANLSGGLTVIRVENITSVPPATVWASRRFTTYDQYPFKTYNYDGVAVDSLIRGDAYQWRIERFNLDGTGRPYEGATSPWSTFTVK